MCMWGEYRRAGRDVKRVWREGGKKSRAGRPWRDLSIARGSSRRPQGLFDIFVYLEQGDQHELLFIIVRFGAEKLSKL